MFLCFVLFTDRHSTSFLPSTLIVSVSLEYRLRISRRDGVLTDDKGGNHYIYDDVPVLRLVTAMTGVTSGVAETGCWQKLRRYRAELRR